MTVNDYKETACATAGPVEDMEIEGGGPVLNTSSASPTHDSENLLGRVLAGSLTFIFTNGRLAFLVVVVLMLF